MSQVIASLTELLAERQRRAAARAEEAAKRAAEIAEVSGQTEAGRAKTAALAAEFRKIYEKHPKQAAFCRSRAKRKLGICTRRAGKSSGENREELARAIEEENFRCTYVNQTRTEAKGIAWRGDTGDGWLDLIGKHGELTKTPGVYRLGGVLAKVNETELSIDFSNGSRLDIFSADDERSINKLRGRAKSKIRIDEAGKFRFLRRFINEVADPALRDFEGEPVLTGTPTDEMEDSYFYDCSKEAGDGDPPLEGWEVHRWSVIDNPAFGDTQDERWERTAGYALRMNGWTGEEPAFLREWLGKWVRSDMRMVYAVNTLPDEKLIFAPQRLQANEWYDHAAAVRDLPKSQAGGRGINWMYAMGCDFAYWPDSFAIVLWAFSLDHPDIYEMFVYKRTKLDADAQRDAIKQLFDEVDGIVVLVGDPGGALTQAAMAGWRERLGLPIEDADKAGKHTWIENMNADIRRGRVHFRKDSPLLHEMKHLMWLPNKSGKPKEHDNRRLSDGSTPGRDACDAALYSYRHLSHWLAKDPVPEQTPAQRLDAELEKHLAAVERSLQQDGNDDFGGWSY